MKRLGSKAMQRRRRRRYRPSLLGVHHDLSGNFILTEDQKVVLFALGVLAAFWALSYFATPKVETIPVNEPSNITPVKALS